jgi:pilus assembly protein CpaC
MTTDATLTIGRYLSHTLVQPGLIRAAVANSKIVRARSLGAEKLLLTGMRTGTTMVRTWNRQGRESAYLVRVIESDLAVDSHHAISEGVVKISMEFMELDSASTRELGLKWPESIEYRGALEYQGTMSTSGLNYSASVLTARGILNFLSREGFARTLANPELFVRMGEQASFHSGGEIPIPGSSGGFGHFYKKVEWKPFGLSIQVRPSSEDGHRIHSDIRVDISELNTHTAVEGIPGLNRRKMETKMDAADGETVVLSALLRQTSSIHKEGLPGFSNIPILGYLFSTQNRQAEESEIILAMTFSILNPQRENRRLETFRGKFRDD